MFTTKSNFDITLRFFRKISGFTDKLILSLKIRNSFYIFEVYYKLRKLLFSILNYINRLHQILFLGKINITVNYYFNVH